MQELWGYSKLSTVNIHEVMNRVFELESHGYSEISLSLQAPIFFPPQLLLSCFGPGETTLFQCCPRSILGDHVNAVTMVLVMIVSFLEPVAMDMDVGFGPHG